MGVIVLREEKSLEDDLNKAEHFYRKNENDSFLNDFYFYDKRFNEVFTTEEKISLYLDITKEKWFKREIFFKALLDSVEDLDHQDKNGWTSLHRLAFEGHVLGVERLLDAGADPELKTKEGLTPFQLFSLGTNIEEIKDDFDPLGNMSLIGAGFSLIFKNQRKNDSFI